jgi:hypothetical protein
MGYPIDVDLGAHGVGTVAIRGLSELEDDRTG